MNKKSSEPAKEDRRPLALLLFALVILILTALRSSWLAEPNKEPPAPQKLVWRDDGTQTPGLYRASTDKEDPGQPLPARLAPLFFKPIPINQADEELLATIPGIGPAFARRIIEFREQQGRINAIEELDEVKGVGPAKLRILAEHLVVD